MSNPNPWFKDGDQQAFFLHSEVIESGLWGRLSECAKAVLIVLAHHGHRPNMLTLQRDAGLSAGGVFKGLKELREIGLVLPATKESDGSGFVYLYEFGNCQKIGRSVDPLNRVKDFSLPGALIGVIATRDMVSLEAQLHARFREYCIGGEWFKLPGQLVNAIVAMSC